MGNEQGRRVKDYAKTGVSAVRFRCKERGKRVKDRAKKGASMEDRGTGFSVLAAREMKRGPFFARSLTVVPHSLLLNCTKRLLRRLGLDLGAKTLRIRLYGVGCPVPLGGYFLLGVSRISCRSFRCLRSFPLAQASKPLLAQFIYHWNVSIQKGSKFPYFNKTAFVHNFSLLNTTERTTCITVF